MSKLKDPRLWASLLAAVVGIQLGINAGITAHQRSVESQVNWQPEDRERLQGIILAFLPKPILGFTLAGIAGVWLLIPDPNRQARESDRQIVARIARQRLGASALSESELIHWSKVLDEMEGQTNGKQ